MFQFFSQKWSNGARSELLMALEQIKDETQISGVRLIIAPRVLITKKPNDVRTFCISNKLQRDTLNGIILNDTLIGKVTIEYSFVIKPDVMGYLTGRAISAYGCPEYSITAAINIRPHKFGLRYSGLGHVSTSEKPTGDITKTFPLEGCSFAQSADAAFIALGL